MADNAPSSSSPNVTKATPNPSNSDGNEDSKPALHLVQECIPPQDIVTTTAEASTLLLLFLLGTSEYATRN